jgi:hypothetical protein
MLDMSARSIEERSKLIRTTFCSPLRLFRFWKKKSPSLRPSSALLLIST